MIKFIVTFIGISLLVVSTQAALKNINRNLDDIWENFKRTHNKNYVEGEKISRRLIWEENVRMIEEHNRLFDLKQKTYTLGINAFADLTHEEIVKFYLGTKMNANKQVDEGQRLTYMSPLNVNGIPANVDWRKKGYVTPVKNQGHSCGSCWAFSTTGAMEGQYYRKNKILESFSEQQLMDCSWWYGNHGCHGGLALQAFKYLMTHKLEKEQSYSYKAQHQKCQYNEALGVVSVKNYYQLPQGNESILTEAIATVGPISVAIDANHTSFKFYKSGVFNEPNCSPIDLDHGILAVGYGTIDNNDYYIVKNSWGSSWGLNGFGLMSRNNQNQCGIATMASYPIL